MYPRVPVHRKVKNARWQNNPKYERQQVVRVARSVARSVEASHMVQRSPERLSLIQWIVRFSSPVCGKTDVRSDSH